MARLLFIGMWNFCDDAGIHPASTKTLKAEVFPADDITASEISALVDELISNGLLIEYKVGEKPYWQVTGWHHQKIEKPNFKHPKPEIRQPVGEQSASSRRAVGNHSPPEWSGEEGKGEELKPLSVVAGSSEPETSPAKTAEQPAQSRKGVVCGLLRKAGMADAAPHYLTDDTWGQILAKRTDEEIVEVAKAKMAARAGQRTGLKYIAPALLQDPEPIAANARASPSGYFAQQEHTLATLTGRTRNHERTSNERDITGEAVRIA